MPSRQSLLAVLACAAPLGLLAPALPGQAPAPASGPPKAFDLLSEVKAAYAGLASYRDHGAIETAARPGAPAVPRRRFETVARADGGFRFTLETGEGIDARREVLWGSARHAQHYDSARAAFRPAASWLSALVTLMGEGSLDALLVPALLAGGPEVLPEPAAAAVEGPAACGGAGGEASCWVLTMTPFGGGVESRLWVDRASRLIRRLEVRPAAGEAALPAGVAPERPALVRVAYEIDAAGGPVSDADLAFAPPPGARRVAGWSEAPAPEARAAASPGGAAASGTPEASFGEVIDVALFSLTVRAVDDAGNPIRGLGPGDFRASLDGVEIPIAAADWFSSEGAAAGEEAEASPAAPPSEPGVWPPEPPLPDEGQLVVFFVQADINAPSRTRGQLKTLPYARDLLDTLKPADRVAVLAFDSHLKLWLDFTRDHAAAFEAIGRAIRFGADPGPLPPPREARSLARHFDAGAAKAAASPEQALQVVGRALTPLPGEKVVIYMGWGMGNYTAGVGSRPTRDYNPALKTLSDARASVFVLDITDASAHSLEFGLQSVAAATGGTYAKTVDFPAQAALHLARVISGHYVLSFDAERLKAGGTLSVALRNRKGRLLYKPVTITG